ncbi:hypothetical protein [Leptospira fluminis]|uniref:hypothetical protein n=1 Tax=Leptospira fluminis TaxID=2484979 RepID=UPI001FE5E1B7|nr:hypothetical protein [Leptospira fluminis]
MGALDPFKFTDLPGDKVLKPEPEEKIPPDEFPDKTPAVLTTICSKMDKRLVSGRFGEQEATKKYEKQRKTEKKRPENRFLRMIPNISDAALNIK